MVHGHIFVRAYEQDALGYDMANEALLGFVQRPSRRWHVEHMHSIGEKEKQSVDVDNEISKVYAPYMRQNFMDKPLCLNCYARNTQQ